MLLASDEISDGSGGSSATPVSKRKSKGEEDNDVEDQLSVKKKQGQKKIKGEWKSPIALWNIVNSAFIFRQYGFVVFQYCYLLDLSFNILAWDLF